MKIRWMLLLALSLGLAGCATTGKPLPPLQGVPQVDLPRYMGTWYEIARFPHRFQEGCYGSRATYILASGGRIDVYNECHRGGPDGEISAVRGRAWVIESRTNAKLRVSFFWPFTGDYWIIDLGADYDYAVVGHPKRNYLWILSRTPGMEEGLYNRILERLKAQGYDLSPLVKSPPWP
jgi:apolipoprotein D and lipocalin family protein